MWLCMLLHVWLASWISQFDFAGWFSPFWLAGWIFTTFVVVWVSGTSAWADMRILEVFHLVVNSFCDELRWIRLSDGGEISKTLFWVFSPVSWVIWMFWFLDLKRSMKIDFIWSCETRNWLLKSGNRVSETKLYVSHVASRFSQDVNWS